MTRHIDQAPGFNPHDQPSQNNGDTQPVDPQPHTFEKVAPLENEIWYSDVHPDDIKRLGGKFGQPERSTPEVTEPEQSLDSSKNKLFTRGRLIGATAFTAIAATAAVLLSGGHGGSDNEKEAPRANGGNTTASAPIIPGAANESAPVGTTQGEFQFSDKDIEAMSPEMFAEISFNQRMNHYIPKFDTWKDDSYSLLKPQLNAQQNEVLNNEFPDDKSQYTNQQIANRLSIDLYDASSQQGEKDDIAARQKMLHAIMGDGSPVLNNYLNLVKSGSLNYVWKIDDSKSYDGVLKNITLRGVDIGDLGARLLYATPVGVNMDPVYMLVQDRKTDEGNETWTLDAFFDPNDNRSIANDIEEAQNQSN